MPLKKRKRLLRPCAALCGAAIAGLLGLSGCGSKADPPNEYVLPAIAKVAFGDDAAWKRPAFDDRLWAETAIPAPLRKGGEDYRGYYWYRLWFVPPPFADADVGVSLGTIGDIDEVYLNGQWIGRSGQFYPGGRIAFHQTRVYRLPEGLLKPGQANLLAIRGQKVTFLQAGIYKGRPAIAAYSALQARADRSYFFSSRLSLFFGLFSLLFGLYHFFLYLRLPQKQMNLWYFLFSLASAVFMISLGWKFAEWISSLSWIIRLHALAGIFSAGLFLIYTVLAIGRGFSWPARGLLTAHALFLPPLLFLGDSLRIYQVFTLWYPLCFLTILYLLGVTVGSVRRGRRDLSFLVAAMVYMLGAAVLDILYGLGWIDLFQVSSSGFFALNLGIMFSLAHDFTAAYLNVEQQVAARTAELAKAHEELKGLDAAKDRFFSNISHEFRTPLTLALAPIEAFLEKNGNGDPQVVEDFRGAWRNLRRLLGLINDLLLLTRLESAKVTFVPRRMQLVPWLSRVIEAVRPLARKKEIALSFCTNLPEDKIAVFDPQHLEKVPLNLLSNALKFTPRGGRIEVQLMAEEPEGNGFVLTVADSGCGIPREKMGKIFERFEQARDEHQSTGTGIGLSLVKEMVELHSGRIEVDSEEGKGSTFRVLFPFAPPGRQVGDFPSEKSESPLFVPDLDWEIEKSPSRIGPEEGALSSGHLPGAEGGRLLIVEDNPQLRKVLRQTLGSGYEILEAENGQEALQVLEHCAPDCILTDIMMPVMDGVTFVAELRKNPERSGIPVIVCTSKQDAEDKLIAFGAGVNDYVTKPFERRELRARVEAQVRLKRLQEQLLQAGKLAALGTLTAGICHEIRNPLNIIGAEAIRLENGLPAAEWAQIAASIAQQVGRADKIIQDLLRFCRREQDPPQPVELAALAREVLGYLHKEIKSRVAIHQQIPDGLQVSGRPSQLKQALLDLVLNAVQAIPGEGNVWLQAILTAGRQVEITVKDDGQGMSPEVVEKVFEPFYTTKEPGKGTGLGLSIVHQIVHNHNGRIWLESAVGQGTTVHWSIPQALGEEVGG